MKRLSEELNEFDRFMDDIVAECGLKMVCERQMEQLLVPEPEPEPDQERAPEPESSLAYGAMPLELAEWCLQEPEVSATSFSPERRFDLKERRERPPRHYDQSAVEQRVDGEELD